jgi:hypothetical protein
VEYSDQPDGAKIVFKFALSVAAVLGEHNKRESQLLGARQKERLALKIRRDAAFVSSVLFTVAFVCLIPPCWASALAGRHTQDLDAAWAEIARLIHQLGIASLAIIFIGLIVTWAGYVNKTRWTWFVMFIIVWGWAFPLMLLPLILPLFRALSVPVSELLLDALKEPGVDRDGVEEILIFLLMLLALILPIKSFAFPGRKPDANA